MAAAVEAAEIVADYNRTVVETAAAAAVAVAEVEAVVEAAAIATEPHSNDNIAAVAADSVDDADDDYGCNDDCLHRSPIRSPCWISPNSDCH